MFWNALFRVLTQDQFTGGQHQSVHSDTQVFHSNSYTFSFFFFFQTVWVTILHCTLHGKVIPFNTTANQTHLVGSWDQKMSGWIHLHNSTQITIIGPQNVHLQRVQGSVFAYRISNIQFESFQNGFFAFRSKHPTFCCLFSRMFDQIRPSSLQNYYSQQFTKFLSGRAALVWKAVGVNSEIVLQWSPKHKVSVQSAPPHSSALWSLTSPLYRVNTQTWRTGKQKCGARKSLVYILSSFSIFCWMFQHPTEQHVFSSDTTGRAHFGCPSAANSSYMCPIYISVFCLLAKKLTFTNFALDKISQPQMARSSWAWSCLFLKMRHFPAQNLGRSQFSFALNELQLEYSKVNFHGC